MLTKRVLCTEYVENFVMPQSTVKCTGERKLKWTTYLTKDPAGKRIAKCILNDNRGQGWDSEAAMATKLAAVYSLDPDPAHELNADKRIELKLSERRCIQVLNATSCIAQEVGLTIAPPAQSVVQNTPLPPVPVIPQTP